VKTEVGKSSVLVYFTQLFAASDLRGYDKTGHIFCNFRTTLKCAMVTNHG